MKILSQSEMTEWQLETIEYYCRDDLRVLKRICLPLIIKKRIPEMYHDDLYSDAMKVLLESVSGFNKEKKCSFKTFLLGNINKSFYDWTRDNERGIRCNVLKDKNGRIVKEKDENGRERNVVIQNISIHQKVNDEDGSTYEDLIASDFDIFDELPEELGFAKDDKVEKYIQSLSIKQKKIGKLLSSGYTKLEIREILHMTSKEFSDQLNGMKSYRKISILF